MTATTTTVTTTTSLFKESEYEISYSPARYIFFCMYTIHSLDDIYVR